MTKRDRIQRVETPDAPRPFGHYVQATTSGGQVFVSGQLAAGTDGSSHADEPFRAQTRRALQNLLAIVRASGGTVDTVLKVTAYIVGVEHWQAFNEEFAEVFGDTRPARSVVPVPALHNGYLIELDAVAAHA
jgi:2-iminobutanoate/2-iminopropanoate deaminase